MEPVAGVVLAGVVVLFLKLVAFGGLPRPGTVEVAVAAVLLLGLVPLVVPTAVAVTTAWLLATTPGREETLKVGATAATGVLVDAAARPVGDRTSQTRSGAGPAGGAPSRPGGATSD